MYPYFRKAPCIYTYIHIYSVYNTCIYIYIIVSSLHYIIVSSLHYHWIYYHGFPLRCMIALNWCARSRIATSNLFARILKMYQMFFSAQSAQSAPKFPYFQRLPTCSTEDPALAGPCEPWPWTRRSHPAGEQSSNEMDLGTDRNK